ncbi:MAG: hypothetical protein QOH51_932 [Acidobacteriota bacterium]|nr:hypothetical protein [Acidobacteriota bacterium]
MRRYLLGQLSEADGEEVELRLLTDAGYAEQSDIIVDELIDQYVEEDLSEEERERAEQYFLRSSERLGKLKFALALNRYKTQVPVKRHRARSFTRFYLPLAACVLIAVALGAGVWRAFFFRSDVDRGLAVLQTAFRDRRPIEARISGFNYAPLMQQRGAPETGDYAQRDRAASLLLNAVSESGSAGSHQALGKFYLADRQFDKALDQLQEAVRLDPRNAQAHSDLAAAFLEEGKSHRTRTPAAEGEGGGGAIEEFAKGLDQVNRALELDPSITEALFNRALLYQQMALYPQAEEGWRRYLEKDSVSQWAEEARRNLKLIEEQRRAETSRDDDGPPDRDFIDAYTRGDDGRAWEIVGRNYTSAGNRVANALLDSYLDLETKGKEEEAAPKLQAVAYLGQLGERRAGDAYVSELARFYGRLSAAQLRPLLRARSLMREGDGLFLRSNVRGALDLYSRAKRAFDEAGDSGDSILAEYRMGHCYLFVPDLERGDEVFGRLLPICERKGYRWLSGQSLYRMASIRLGRNEYSKSIDYAREALGSAERMGDSYGVLWNLILLADEYQSLNDEKRSLDLLQRSRELVDEGFADPLQTWGIYTAIAFNLNSLGYHPAALEYQKEALRRALVMNRPLIVSRSYDYLGVTYASLNSYDEAISNIDRAYEVGSGLEAGEPSGREMMANSSLHAGDVYRQLGDHGRAVEAYDRSIRLYAELGYTYFTYPAHKGKLLSYMTRGDDGATEEELQTVLRLFEQYRSNLTSESQRNTFFDVEQSIYDLAIDFAQTRRRDPGRAFEYSELSRARSLLDEMREGTEASASAPPAAGARAAELRLPSVSRPAPLPDVERRMPEGAQLLEYAVLDDKLLIWVVTREGVSAEEVRVNARDLGERVREYLRSVKEEATGGTAVGEEKEARQAAGLYDVLISPVEQRLDRSKLLCIAPDKTLHYLPFGALADARTGRRLVEDFRLELSPSASVFVDLSELAARKSGSTEERLLSVGDPSFDPIAFPSLAPLPAAGREAEEVAAFYRSPRLLLRDAATEGAVAGEIGRSTVAHFALHYMVDEHSSMLSGLVLAAEARAGGTGGAESSSRQRKEERPDGLWQAREVYRMRLPATRLVVLSACQTGIEQQYRGEGAVGIARPFLAAGVPLVVASLWPVDSDATERLMVGLHRLRARGGGGDHLPTAEALRRAQIELLRGVDGRYRQPYYWAAFTAIGGYAEF